MTYQWTVIKPDGSNAVLDNATSTTPSFVADQMGEYQVQLIVNDGKAESQPTSVTISVEPVDPISPIAHAGNAQTVTKGSQVTLNGSLSTSNDGGDLRYAWTISTKPEGSLAQLIENSSVTSTFDVDVEGVYEITLQVTNGSGESHTAIVMITVQFTDNLPPIADAGAAQSLPENEQGPITLDGSDSIDPDGTSLNYQWQFVKKPVGSQVVLVNENTVTPSFEADLAGTYTIGLIVNDGEVDSSLDTTAVTIYLPIIEVEPNGSSEQAQVFIRLGVGNPIHAELTSGSDVDWYRFEAEQGQSYTIELYDVKATLAATGGRSCTSTTTYTGLYLVAFDGSINEIRRRCSPAGVENIHNNVVITATETSVHYIRVASNASSSEDNGSYSIRVLPNHNHPSAHWDAVTFEPNNRLNNAYPIQVGVEKALSSQFEARKSGFASNGADVDWYYFEAEAEQTYVVELYDVNKTLAATGGRGCTSATTYTGLYLIVYDTMGNEVKRKCEPRGAGNVHNILSFTTVEAGTYYIFVGLHDWDSFNNGSYSIRALPQYSNVNASWDEVSHEPNNRITNAYEIQLGANNALSSLFEKRKSSFATNRADVDWFRFETEAGQTYVIELYDVRSSLVRTGGRGCVSATTYTGLYLLVYDDIEANSASWWQCSPNGAGNVHSFVQFTPIKTGTHYVRVMSNAFDKYDNGDYRIHLLPSHDHPNANWDEDTYEPNNQLINAYEIQLGEENSLSSAFEANNTAFSTNRADVDWYRFQVEAGKTYAVELFDVEGSLISTKTTRNCNGSNWYSGLYLVVFDSGYDEFRRQCEPIGIGNVYSFIEFTPEITGMHYVFIASHNLQGGNTGNYSVRVVDR